MKPDSAPLTMMPAYTLVWWIAMAVEREVSPWKSAIIELAEG
jgi:hypothetical protein